MSTLFSPFKLRSLVAPNRIVVSPMCQYSADDGRANAWHMIHLGNLALSGAGILFIEATAVESVGRITPGCLGLWDDATESALEPVLAAIRRHSPVRVVQQLAHAGRKASSEVPWRGGQLIPIAAGGWLPHGPSAIEQAWRSTTAGAGRRRLASSARGVREFRQKGSTTWRRWHRAAFGAWIFAPSISVADLQSAHR